MRRALAELHEATLGSILSSTCTRHGGAALMTGEVRRIGWFNATSATYQTAASIGGLQGLLYQRNSTGLC